MHRRHSSVLAPDPSTVTATALAPSHHRMAIAPGDAARAKHRRNDTAPSRTGAHEMRHPFITQGQARHAAAHLAGSIALTDRSETAAVGARAKRWQQTSVGVWQVSDSGSTPQNHPEPDSNDQCG
jgi:hypothetical protein